MKYYKPSVISLARDLGVDPLHIEMLFHLANWELSCKPIKVVLKDGASSIHRDLVVSQEEYRDGLRRLAEKYAEDLITRYPNILHDNEEVDDLVKLTSLHGQPSQKIDPRIGVPIVYAFLLEGRAQYIGMSSAGLRRPFDKKHNFSTRDGCDFYYWQFDTVDQARSAEIIAISKIKPIYNIKGVK